MEGATKEVATALPIHTFLAARAKELTALTVKSSGAAGNPSKTAFKHIPRHLRRRAVSHNVKRLPFYFRPKVNQAHSTGAKGDPLSYISDKKKTKSRKSRRRKSNLLHTYNNRQRVYKWLETHIWHAKRFHIENKWNYKIPITPCTKGQRAIYRAAKRYATVQDITFTSLFELTGPKAIVLQGLKKIIPLECSSSGVDEVTMLSGEREEVFHVYKEKSYPFGYIGQVRIMFVKSSEEAETATLWLWIHPSTADETVSELCKVLGLLRGCFTTPVDSGPATMDVVKLAPKMESWSTHWVNYQDGVKLTAIQGQVNRFRLSGPETLGVLQQILKPTPPSSPALDSSESWLELFDVMVTKIGNSHWNLQKHLRSQSIVLDLLPEATSLPRGTALPFIVRDPRVFLPRTRTKLDTDIVDEDYDLDQEEGTMTGNGSTSNGIIPSSDTDTVTRLVSEYVRCARIPLEAEEFRRTIVNYKMSDQTFCKRRSELLIPGSEIDLGKDENQVPILLILQKPEPGRFDASGYDLIVPSSWAMAFWIALSYRATRAIGYQNAAHLAFLSRNLHSTYFVPPDSSAGIVQELEDESSNRRDYFKYPPAKRPNLIKLNCPCPFKNDWVSLLKLAGAEDVPEHKFYVLRDAKLLSLIANNTKTRYWRRLIENLESIKDINHCLIGCRIETENKGCLEGRAVICLPTVEDINPVVEASKQHSRHTPEESAVADEETFLKRKQLREKHQTLIKLLRKRRKSAKDRFKNSITSTMKRSELMVMKSECDRETKLYDSKLLSTVFNKEMNNSWLIPGEKVIESLNSLSRRPLGFTVYGTDDYACGRCSALGFISAKVLLDWAKVCISNRNLGKFVLCRNWTNSLMYSKVKLHVLPL